MKLDECPAETELMAFALGNVSTRSYQLMERHIDACPQCRERLQCFDTLDDRLMRDLSHYSSVEYSMHEAVPSHVLADAKAAVSTPVADSTEVALDSGRHYARLLQEGPCRLGRFELLNEVGVGSFGYVFRARDLELNRIVAIKVQRAGAFAGQEDVGRFLREARSAASLTHPAIVALYDTGHSEDGVCFLVTEYVEGETLEKRLQRERPDIRTAASLLAEMAEAVHYAHEHSVVHRDLKPSNIILDLAGRAHITDFGLAKRDDGNDVSMTSDGCLLGTPAYMSPEQVLGQSAAIDARTDVYSLGVILYEMLTGERPFQGAKRLLLLQVLEDEPRPPRQLEPRVPRDLETICLKCLSKSPARRYASARHLAQDLRRYLSGEPIEARPIGHSERLWRWCHRYPVAAALLAAVIVGSALGFWYLRHLSAFFVRETALQSTRMEADMMESVNAYYSDVLSRIDTEAVKITHEYMLERDALPLPATFTIDAGERISANQSGLQFRLYSQYPFRPDGGPQDPLQREALEELTRMSNEEGAEGRVLEFHKFMTVEGRPILQYARGQLMKESCRECHNQHKQSPKRDWKVNELAGVLLITRPLDQDIQRTESGFRSAFVVMGLTVVVLVGWAVVAMRSRSRG